MVEVGAGQAASGRGDHARGGMRRRACGCAIWPGIERVVRAAPGMPDRARGSSHQMDKMIIHGGAPLRGAVDGQRQQERRAADPDGGAADRRAGARSATCRACATFAPRSICSAAWASKRAGLGDHDVELHARAHHLARGALRTGQDDARVVLRAGAAARAHRTGAGFDARRMRDRRAAGQPAYRGNPGASARASRCATAMSRPMPSSLTGARVWLDYAFGRRDREHHDGGGARARPHHDRKRGARARGAGPGADADRDGRANLPAPAPT